MLFCAFLCGAAFFKVVVLKGDPGIVMALKHLGVGGNDWNNSHAAGDDVR
jgi:hypothetical protein